MTEITPPVNSVAQGVVDVTKAVVQIGTAALEAAIVAYIPALGLPVVKQLMDALIEWITSKMYTAIAQDETVWIFKFQSYEERTAYESTVSDLKAAQSSGDPLLLTAAQKAFADAASKYIHNDGVVHT